MTDEEYAHSYRPPHWIMAKWFFAGIILGICCKDGKFRPVEMEKVRQIFDQYFPDLRTWPPFLEEFFPFLAEVNQSLNKEIPDVQDEASPGPDDPLPDNRP